MWNCKFVIVLSVLVILASIRKANTLRLTKRYSSNRNGEPNIQSRRSIIQFLGEDGRDSGTLFLLSHDPTPNGNEVRAGLQLFGIPIGPEFSYVNEDDKVTDLPGRRSNLENTARPVEILLVTMINGDGNVANHEPEVVRVPLEQLEDLVALASASAKYSTSKTFALEQESRSEHPAISEEATRRNQRVTAGLKLFGFPVGPQLVYERNDDQNGEESFAVLSPLLSGVEKVAKEIVGGLLFR